MDEKRLLFVDLETTGLDAYEEVPLELAVVLTDQWGEEIDSWETLIYDSTSGFKDRMGEARRHPIVGPMHEKSGLWDAFTDLETNRYEWNSIYNADNKLQEFLSRNGAAQGTVPMAGNSIGSLDRPFFLVHFAYTNRVLSYRNVDMSSIKEICKRVNPVLWQNIEPLLGSKDDAAHRAMDDVRASIHEYQVYLDEFLITEEN